MLKKLLPVLVLPVFLAGCATDFTNLTPRQAERNADNLYPVEVALTSRQQTLRWESIRPQIIVGKDTFPMRATPYMTNRWEGLLPVPQGQTSVQYRYKLDYEYNSLGKPKAGTFISPPYTLRVNPGK